MIDLYFSFTARSVGRSPLLSTANDSVLAVHLPWVNGLEERTPGFDYSFGIHLEFRIANQRRGSQQLEFVVSGMKPRTLA
jgi:hypothetical protein